MTKSIKVWIEPSWDFHVHEGVIEVDDDASEADILQIAEEWVNEQCPWGWEELGDDES